MELVILTRITDLVDLLDAAVRARVESDVSPAALSEIEVVKAKIKDASRDLIETALEVLALTYRHAWDSNAKDLAAPIHEGLYNSFAKGCFPHLFRLLERDDDKLRRIICSLFPDPKIRAAMLNQIPTYVTSATSIDGQLRYLLNRTAVLKEIVEIFKASKPDPKVRQAAFQNFIRLLDKLIAVHELIPHIVKS